MKRFACFFFLVFASTFQSGDVRSEDKLNVLFIAVDDLRPEINCFGGTGITPNLDRLAASGLQFDRAYCNQAVCGASRVSLMTGLYPEYTGERTFHVTDWRDRWPDVVTLNQHFKSNGYQTIGLGKIYHGSQGKGVDPENWTQWLKVKGAQYANPENLKRMKKKSSKDRSRGEATEVSNAGDEFHPDGNRAATGAARIHELSKNDEPFFLAVGFTKPHLPFVAPEKYWNLYDRDQFKMPPNKGVPPGYPEYAGNRYAGEIRSYSDIPGGDIREFPDELNTRLIHGYHACVSYVDRNIGVLLDALEQSGAAENTVVVLWADHGWKLGDHSTWCKHTNFECDTRVPLIVRHPKLIQAKGRSKSLVELIDLYPTLCELCGLETPEHIQGKSFASVLKNKESKHREFAYSSYPHSRGKKRRGVTGHSIRTDRYRYTEWWEKNTDKVVSTVLTDIEKDPWETTSIPDESDRKTALSSMLRKQVLAVRKP